jgi:hypothetical protein
LTATEGDDGDTVIFATMPAVELVLVEEPQLARKMQDNTKKVRIAGRF